MAPTEGRTTSICGPIRKAAERKSSLTEFGCFRFHFKPFLGTDSNLSRLIASELNARLNSITSEFERRAVDHQLKLAAVGAKSRNEEREFEAWREPTNLLSDDLPARFIDEFEAQRC